VGGTAPYCPFCLKLCADSGVKDHIKAKHGDKYDGWIKDGQQPYFLYDADGNLIPTEPSMRRL